MVALPPHSTSIGGSPPCASASCSAVRTARSRALRRRRGAPSSAASPRSGWRTSSPRRDHGGRARGPRSDADRARHRGGADVSAPSRRDRAAGAHRERRRGRALHARHRPLAQDRDRGHVRALATRIPRATWREYLAVLTPLLRGEPVDHQGRGVPRARGRSQVPGGAPVRAAGRGARARACCASPAGYADGTITWMTGAKTLADAHRCRRSRKAASDGGPPRAAHRRGPADRAGARRRRGARDGVEAVRDLRPAAVVPRDARPRGRGAARRRRDRRRREGAARAASRACATRA